MMSAASKAFAQQARIGSNRALQRGMIGTCRVQEDTCPQYRLVETSQWMAYGEEARGLTNSLIGVRYR